MEQEWTPKPGDVVYCTHFDINNEDETLGDPGRYARLARVVVRAGGALCCVDLDAPFAQGFHARRGDGTYHDEAARCLVYALPFDPRDYAPTLAAAVRGQAERDLDFCRKQAAAAARVLAAADRIATAGEPNP